MGVIWTPQQRITQPQLPVRLNQNNPLIQGIRFATDGDFYDVVNKTQPTFVGATRTVGSAGRAISLNGGTDDHVYWPVAPLSSAGTELTISFLVSLTATPALSVIGGYTFNNTFNVSDSPGNRRALIAYPGSPGNLYWWGDAADYDSGVATNATGALRHYVITKSAGNVSPAVRVYVDGVLVASGTLAGYTLLAPSSMWFVVGSKHSTGSTAATGKVYGAAAWERQLIPSEIASLAKNPWQVFAPDIRPKVFYVAGGGGSTVTGAGSSDGVGTVLGVGASTSAQVGSSSGTGTASGVGASTAASVGSSSGTGAADGVGSSTGGSDGVGASTSTGTASGIGASTAASTGSSDGVGTGSGVGASTAASVGSASGTGEALGVGANGSVVSTGVGSASGTGTATGISPTVSRGGGKTTGSNLSRKQKKKLKAVESQEWLKAEETARQLLSDRFTKQTPQEKAQALETYIESLQPVIEALKALTSQIEEVVEEAPVIELTPHQEVIQRFDRLEKKVKSVEELIIILMADL